MLKILIAEDEAPSKMVLAQHIRAMLGPSALIECASNGQEAVTIASRFSPQLIFMDIEMPLLSGIEAAEIIRRQQPDARIIFLTAFDRFDYAVGALRAGGIDYLLKPFQKQDIDRYLHELGGDFLPSEPEETPFQSQFQVWLSHHYMENISVETVAESMGISSFYFSRLFRASYNKTFLEYLTDYRMERAKQLLCSTELSVREISVMVGYADPGYFTKVFRRQTGKTPTEYRLQTDDS